MEELEQRGKSSRGAALEIVALLDAKKDRDAAELIGKVHLEDLSALEQRLIGRRIVELRRDTSETSYKNARSLLKEGRQDAAVKEFAELQKKLN